MALGLSLFVPLFAQWVTGCCQGGMLRSKRRMQQQQPASCLSPLLCSKWQLHRLCKLIPLQLLTVHPSALADAIAGGIQIELIL